MLGAWLAVAALALPGTALAQALQPYVVVGEAISKYARSLTTPARRNWSIWSFI
jgi:hypothetical protein